jgi:hypothetical protein
VKTTLDAETLVSVCPACGVPSGIFASESMDVLAVECVACATWYRFDGGLVADLPVSAREELAVRGYYATVKP